MKKVIRIIMYEGKDDWVDKTLSKSLNLGVNRLSPNGSISIFDKTTFDFDKSAESNESRNYDELFKQIDNLGSTEE